MNDAERRIEEEKAWELWESFQNTSGYEEPKLLNTCMVEKGEVYIESIYKDASIEIAILTLTPGAEIRDHLHLYDSEIYLDLQTGEKIGKCEQFKRHSLKNPSKSHYLFVLSIKTMGRR